MIRCVEGRGGGGRIPEDKGEGDEVSKHFRIGRGHCVCCLKRWGGLQDYGPPSLPTPPLPPSLPPQVNDMQRSHAKAVAYGLIYGKGATTLAKELGISVGEAEKVGVCGCRGWVGISVGETAKALNIQSPLLLSSPANPAPPPRHAGV